MLPILPIFTFVLTSLFRLASYVLLRWLPGALYLPSVCLYGASCAVALFAKWTGKEEKVPVVQITETVIEERRKKGKKQAKADADFDAVLAQAVAQYETVPKGAQRRSFASSVWTFVSTLFGYVTPRSSKGALAGFLIVNTVVLAAVFDFVLAEPFLFPHTDLAFVRTGHVSRTSAKILGRLPNNTHAQLVYRPSLGDTAWINGPRLAGDPENDFTLSAVISGLVSDTEYEYKVVPEHEYKIVPLSVPSKSASRDTPPAQTKEHHIPDEVHRFTTAPGDTKTLFSFAFASCMKPGFPYRGPWKRHTLPGASFLDKKASALDFFLFIGDWIYADIPYFGGPKFSWYAYLYRQVFSIPELGRVLQKVPLIGAFDDHEFVNDFDSGKRQDVLEPALQAWDAYMHAGNPAPHRRNKHYFSFDHGGASFFVLDTRLHRIDNTRPDTANKTMLGARQHRDLLNWLADKNQTSYFKFIVSSVPMMTLWQYGPDVWNSYLAERDAILDAAQYVPNVIVLSGDRHEFASATLRDTITEFSTSPFSQFYIPVPTVSGTNLRGATGEDKLLKYVPTGNNKFTQIDVDTRDPAAPEARVSLYVDGEPVWNYTVHGRPITGAPPVPAIVRPFSAFLRYIYDLWRGDV